MRIRGDLAIFVYVGIVSILAIIVTFAELEASKLKESRKSSRIARMDPSTDHRSRLRSNDRSQRPSELATSVAEEIYSQARESSILETRGRTILEGYLEGEISGDGVDDEFPASTGRNPLSSSKRPIYIEGRTMPPSAKHRHVPADALGGDPFRVQDHGAGMVGIKGIPSLSWKQGIGGIE
eukprot:g1567.t1